MGMNFPPNASHPSPPTIGELFPSPPVEGVPLYMWDGEKWVTQTAGGAKVPIYTDGSTPMAAQLTLIAPPVAPTDAAAKSYVDGKTPIPATAAEYVANSAPSKMLTPGAVWTGATPVVSGPTGSLAPDMGVAFDFVWTINSATGMLNNPVASSAKIGQKGIIYIVQGAGGGFAIPSANWGSQYKFPAGIKPTLTTTAGAIDAVSYVVKSLSEILCVFNADLK